jgi:hypothetical protein
LLFFFALFVLCFYLFYLFWYLSFKVHSLMAGPIAGGWPLAHCCWRLLIHLVAQRPKKTSRPATQPLALP